MKRLLTIFGTILLAQSMLAAPANVEGPELDPELRGILDSLLSSFTKPIIDGLATAGQGILSSAINGAAGVGGSIVSTALGAINSVPGVSAFPMNIEQEEQLQSLQHDDTLLDAFNAIMDQIILDQPTATEPTMNGVAQDEIPGDDVEEIPLYVVIV